MPSEPHTAAPASPRVLATDGPDHLKNTQGRCTMETFASKALAVNGDFFCFLIQHFYTSKSLRLEALTPVKVLWGTSINYAGKSTFFCWCKLYFH